MLSAFCWASSIVAWFVSAGVDSRWVRGGAPVRVEGLPKPGASGMCWPVVCGRGTRDVVEGLAVGDEEVVVDFAVFAA